MGAAATLVGDLTLMYDVKTVGHCVKRPAYSVV